MDQITEVITIHGMVQGIGFRPFIARLAKQCNITGNVRNVNGEVLVNATAPSNLLHIFCEKIIEEKPYGAIIEKIDVRNVQLTTYDSFVIIKSDSISREDEFPLIPPDLSVCPDCLQELENPDDARYEYPFISCVKCGPRYSIIDNLPYDRERTSMKIFDMCPQCYMQYTTMDNRRMHAQTISCHNCGPQLELHTRKKKSGSVKSENKKANYEKANYKKFEHKKFEYEKFEYEKFEYEKIEYKKAAYDKAVSMLNAGNVLLVKDIGGFHLVANAFDDNAAVAIRNVKNREKKPFAVMFLNVDHAKNYCEINEYEQNLMASPIKPIVLVKKKKSAISKYVLNNSPFIGAMLPCNPLQYMLVRDCGPLIMTSANKSGQPIITDDNKAIKWFFEEIQIKGILTNKRKILVPLDDSIVREISGQTQILRRARGFVPSPVEVKNVGYKQMMAAGGDLKSTLAFSVEGKVYMSQYMGDVESEEIAELYEKTKTHMRDLFGFNPSIYICDKHPKYHTSIDLSGCDNCVKVQHHIAHALSVVAEHNLEEDVLAVVCDGTGYGDDGNIWGSEIFEIKSEKITHIGSLCKARLIGGDEGAKNAQTMLMGYLSDINVNIFNANHILNRQTNGKTSAKDNCECWLKRKDDDFMKKYTIINKALHFGINSVTTSSMGRLFDAVSSMLGICDYNSYEGEAAIELEYEAYKCNKQCEELYKISFANLFEDIAKGILQGITISELALSFINSAATEIVSRIIIETKERNIRCVVLSGGTFQNKILLERILKMLDNTQIKVYFNNKVPCNDAGICLGQIYMASVYEK